MNQDYQPQWKHWTPVVCKEYWKKSYLSEWQTHIEIINQVSEEIGYMPTEIEISKQFFECYQDDILFQYEKLLTDLRAQEFWEKIEKLKLNEHLVLLKIGVSKVSKTLLGIHRQDAEIAAQQDEHAKALLKLLGNDKQNDEQQRLISSLKRMIKKNEYVHEQYQEHQELVMTNDTTRIDDLMFCRSMSIFFWQQVRRPCDKLVSICASILFDKEISEELVKKRRKNLYIKQTVLNLGVTEKTKNAI